MYIYEYQFKVKPNFDENEMLRLIRELAFPILRKMPGCISANLIKHLETDAVENPEWDYAWVTVWESDDAFQKALRYIRPEDSELAKTGFYDKTLAMIKSLQRSRSILLASSKSVVD